MPMTVSLVCHGLVTDRPYRLQIESLPSERVALPAITSEQIDLSHLIMAVKILSKEKGSQGCIYTLYTTMQHAHYCTQ